MKKLIQTRLNSEEVVGNCFPTVIACLLDKDSPEDVLQFQEFYHREDESWFEMLEEYLDGEGWQIGFYSGHLLDDEYYLVSGISSRGVSHICVYLNGKLFHDPHPSGEGLETEFMFCKLTKQQQHGN